MSSRRSWTTSREHDAKCASEERLLRGCERDNEMARRTEAKARAFDRLMPEDADLVVFERRSQRVLSADDLRDLVEGREPAAPVEQVQQQHVPLLGGGGLE